MRNIKEIIRAKIKEMSSTTQGGASFNTGEGANYATPFAFSKKEKPAKYYYKLGYKSIPKFTPKSFDKKQLWEDEVLNEKNEFQQKRLDGLKEIEDLLNEITPLVSNSKNSTIELYSGNAGSYDITQPIEIVLSYLREVKQLLTEK